MAFRSFSSSNAVSQKCRCRISLSRGNTSYSTESRDMVSRWALTIASETNPRQLGQLPFARLDRMQGLGAPVPARRLGLVVRGRPRVEVPAVVVEANLGVIDERLNIGRTLVLDEVEARDDIGHLHAGVVNVILYLDLVTQLAQHPYERVAQHRVAQVSDVRLPCWD